MDKPAEQNNYTWTKTFSGTVDIYLAPLVLIPMETLLRLEQVRGLPLGDDDHGTALICVSSSHVICLTSLSATSRIVLTVCQATFACPAQSISAVVHP